MRCLDYLRWLQYNLDQTDVTQIDCCSNVSYKSGDGFVVVFKSLQSRLALCVFTVTPLNSILRIHSKAPNKVSVLWVTPNNGLGGKKIYFKSSKWVFYSPEFEKFVMLGKYGSLETATP